MKKVIVVDLDGTLINTNTFTHFCKFLLSKPWYFFPIGCLVLGRKLRLYSHSCVKQWIIQFCKGNLSNAEIESFVGKLIANYLNQKVEDLISERKKEEKVILLATAAPELYAARIASCCGIENVLATRLGEAENVSSVKAENVETWLRRNNALIEEVLTDHYDDIPLLKMAQKMGAIIRVVNPSRKSFQKFKDSSLRFELI